MTEKPKASKRSEYYRKYKKILCVFEMMNETGFVSDEQKKEWFRIADAIYAEWKRQLKEARKPYLKKPGRPKQLQNRVYFTQCKREGCTKEPQEGQAYCSKECAPLANYGKSRRFRAA